MPIGRYAETLGLEKSLCNLHLLMRSSAFDGETVIL
jgi:hypothetical protein